jgi:hypothetical protein
MSRQFEEFLDEDECCLNCGEIDYTPSKVMGICKFCAADPNHIFDNSDFIDESDAF